MTWLKIWFNTAAKTAKDNRPILAVLLLYVVLVFYHFFKLGFVTVDEGYYFSVSRTMSDILRALFFSPGKIFAADFYRELISSYGAVYTGAKPAYMITAAIIDFFYHSVYSTRLVSAASGGAIVTIFYSLLGFFTPDKKLRAVLATILLGSPLFLVFSRNGLSVMTSAAFLLAAFYCLLKFQAETGRYKYLFLSGPLAALSFMNHYGSLVSAVLIFVGGLWLLYRQRATLMVCLKYLLTFMAAPLVWGTFTWLIFTAIRLKGFLPEKSFTMLSYFGEVLEQMKRSGASQGLNFDGIFSYLVFFLRSEGVIIFGLLLIGLVYFLKQRKDFKFSAAAIFTLLALAAVSLSQLKVSRVLVPLLPFIYLIALVPLVGLKRRYALLILAATLVTSFNQYRNIFFVSSRIDETADYIKENYQADQVIIYSPAATLLRPYLDSPRYKVGGMDDLQKTLADETIDSKSALAVIDFFHPTDFDLIKNLDPKLLASYPVEVLNVPQIVGDGGVENAFNTGKGARPEIDIYKISVDNRSNP